MGVDPHNSDELLTYTEVVSRQQCRSLCREYLLQWDWMHLDFEFDFGICIETGRGTTFQEGRSL